MLIAIDSDVRRMRRQWCNPTNKKYVFHLDLVSVHLEMDRRDRLTPEINEVGDGSLFSHASSITCKFINLSVTFIRVLDTDSDRRLK